VHRVSRFRARFVQQAPKPLEIRQTADVDPPKRRRSKAIDASRSPSGLAQAILQTLRKASRPVIGGVLAGALLVTASSAGAEVTPDERFLKARVTRLVDQSFGGDLDKAFAHYAGLARKDGAIDETELCRLLGDAKVGNLFTRSTWVRRVIERFDRFPGAVKNGKVDRVELDQAIVAFADPAQVS
jgi:hypothetical protein